ncbi:protein LNK1-like [Senna tora]|uniref:Protein LNK1-like n=1 Tax=Senna tora TaxID=362788 RepID=A0A834SGL0_9FABA|nr:protein LNK1-like [Senna tora]
MLEKGSWSHTPEGVFPSSNADSNIEVKRLASDNTGMSHHCFKSSNIDSSGSELCADDAILGDKCVVEDDSVCQYPMNHVSQTDNELSFLDNDGWLDIGNFEDVDRMFSCDSTFGIGSLSNEEEFCWITSSHGTEGSDEALKSDFKFSCSEATQLKSIPGYNMDSEPNIEGPLINDPNKRSSIDNKMRSLMNVDDDAVPSPVSMFGDSDMKSGNSDDLRSKDKRKLPKPSEGRIKDDILENGDSFHPFAPTNQYGDVNQPYEASSSGVTSHDGIQEHKQNLNSESSFASNKDSSLAHPLQAASLKINDKGDKLYHSHNALPLSKSFKNENISSVVSFNSQGSARQQLHQSENENEGHSAVQGVSIGFSQEMDSLNGQGSSSMSSALEELSLEATNFRQLRQVMDQLDIRTKMCIRDSLYRLARSAEQRHNYANINGSIGDDDEACKAMAQDTSRCTGFMDIETDTNPIDRSIAHLLFHRPSDQSMITLDGTIPFKSNVMILGSVTNPPVGTENQVCQEEASTGMER